VLELYLQVNAHPQNPGGLAPSTYERYESLIGLHMLDKARPAQCVRRRQRSAPSRQDPQLARCPPTTDTEGVSLRALSIGRTGCSKAMS
jgi:hypothetical protein